MIAGLHSLSGSSAALYAPLFFLFLVYRLLRPALIASTMPGITAKESKRILYAAFKLVAVFAGTALLMLLVCTWLSSRRPSASITGPKATHVNVLTGKRVLPFQS